MLKFFFPSEEDFFQLFQQAAEKLAEVSDHLKALLSQLENTQTYLALIQKNEHDADEIITNTFQKLHKTFITPFDRYDIHRFVKHLNTSIEAILQTAERVAIYELDHIPAEMHTLADLVQKSSQAILIATKKLSNLKNATMVLEQCHAINDFESEAEKVLLIGVAKLFQGETDIKKLLKLKEIYEYTKAILDENEGVANIIKDIVLEYS